MAKNKQVDVTRSVGKCWMRNYGAAPAKLKIIVFWVELLYVLGNNF